MPHEGWVSVNGGGTYRNGNGGYEGGGGSAGVIHLQARTLTCASTTLYVDGGSGDGGNSGSAGRVRIDADTYAGGCSPTQPALYGPAVNVPLPSSWASVRVVTLAGQPVPPVPGNEYTVPDVTVDSTAALAVAIEARNIPRGTVVKLIVASEGSGAGTADQTIETTPLAGDSDALTTASASVVLPRGVSRVHVRAVW